MTPYCWTPEIDAEIVGARKRGELLRVIAARLGTSRTTLSQHLRNLDPALVSKRKGADWGGYPKPGPTPQSAAARATHAATKSEVRAAKQALDSLRKRTGLDAKAERDARIAARRAANEARVQQAHQVYMTEHQTVVLTYEVLARRHVGCADRGSLA